VGYGLDGAIRLETDQLMAILEVLEHVTDEIPGRAVLQAELERRRRLGMGMVEADADTQLGVCPACGKSKTVVNTGSDRFVCRSRELGPGRGVLGCGAMWRGARTGPR
jgi:hypothetical protein